MLLCLSDVTGRWCASARTPAPAQHFPHVRLREAGQVAQLAPHISDNFRSNFRSNHTFFASDAEIPDTPTPGPPKFTFITNFKRLMSCMPPQRLWRMTLMLERSDCTYVSSLEIFPFYCSWFSISTLWRRSLQNSPVWMHGNNRVTAVYTCRLFDMCSLSVTHSW